MEQSILASTLRLLQVVWFISLVLDRSTPIGADNNNNNNSRPLLPLEWHSLCRFLPADFLLAPCPEGDGESKAMDGSWTNEKAANGASGHQR
jgi:hypothetical protein